MTRHCVCQTIICSFGDGSSWDQKHLGAGGEYGASLNSFNPEIKRLVRRLKRISDKIDRNEESVQFNPMHPPTHTPIYIYIYIYRCVCVREREKIQQLVKYSGALQDLYHLRYWFSRWKEGKKFFSCVIDTSDRPRMHLLCFFLVSLFLNAN